MNINTCWITVNRVCNLRCFFCYAKNTKYSNTSTMQFDNAKRVVDFCKEGGIDNIILIGGEPTVYQNLFQLIKYAKSYNISTTLVTNGVKLQDLEYCKKLVDSGISNINISIKGNDVEDFIKVTEFNKFDAVMTAIKNLTFLNTPFSCSMVITKENIFSFCKGVKNAFTNGAKYIGFSFAYDFCMEEEKDPNYLSNNDPQELISNFIAQIDELNNITGGMWSLECGFPLCVYKESQLSILKPHLATSCQLLEKGGIIFDPMLNIIPCNTMFPIKLGQLGTDFKDFKSFLAYSQKGIYKDSIDYLTSLPSEKCLKCSLLEYCGGGCVNFWTHCSFDELESFKELHY